MQKQTPKQALLYIQKRYPHHRLIWNDYLKAPKVMTVEKV